METTKEALKVFNEISNEIKEDEFVDAQLPPSTLFNLETTFNNSNSTIKNNNPSKTNNNRHVVPFGIFVIFCTLYLTVSAFQRTNQTKSAILDKQKQTIDQQKQATYLDKLLEHKDICNELEIFVNTFQWTTDKYDDNDNSCEKEINTETAGEADGDGDTEMETTTADLKKQSKRQLKKQSNANILLRKQINGKKLKNGQNGKRYNKSKQTKNRKNTNKHSIANKKQEENKQKSSTAEAIIYLFALVLIYLLFKAASDINQHYKLQAKGDKRLRRCSLQSYAQAHKQDRRASKDRLFNALKPKHQLLEQRSQSLDRFSKSYLKQSNEKFEFLSNLQKQISIDDPILQSSLQNQKLTTTSTTAIQFFAIFNDKTKQTQSVGNIFNTSSGLGLTTNRRCSVPALTIQTKKNFINNPSVVFSTTTTTTTANRRTSVVYGANVAGQLGQLGNSFDATDPFQFSESKRRVRMINRH